METRANFVVVGALTLLTIVAGLGFFVWLAQFQVNRQFDYYDVLFDNVSGLSRASDVRFNGLSVGQVTSIDLSDKHPGKVSVRIEVVARTPVTDDTTAQLASQGVTGVSFVSLISGREDSPLLKRANDEVPEITGKRSVVDALSQDAPELISQSIQLVGEVKKVFGPERNAQVDRILGNIEGASAKLDTALGDFSTLSQSLKQAAGQVAAFTDRLDPIGSSVQTTLGKADAALDAANIAFAHAETALGASTGALTSAKTTFDDADAVLREKLPGIVSQLSDAVAMLHTAVAEISGGASSVLGKFGVTADTATDRLVEMKATLASLDAALATATQTLGAVGSASGSVQKLLDGEGTGLVTDARTSLAELRPGLQALDKALANDLPAITTQVEEAVATANHVIDQVGRNVATATSGIAPLTTRADATLATATQTLRDASATLAKIDGAIDTAGGAITAAEATFGSAKRVMDEDVAPTAADIRNAASQINTTATRVADDLPAVTSDLRTTIARATATIDRIDSVAAASAGPVEQFTTSGLPQLVRFAAEARALVARLDALTARLESNPAGFFLGNRAPDYRR